MEQESESHDLPSFSKERSPLFAKKVQKVGFIQFESKLLYRFDQEGRQRYIFDEALHIAQNSKGTSEGCVFWGLLALQIRNFGYLTHSN